LAVVSGGPLQTGAARLSAAAGQRVGAGWVSLIGDPAAALVMAHHETERLILARPPDHSLLDLLTGFDALVIGPGLGLSPDRRADILSVLRGFDRPIVLDGDGLALLAQDGVSGELGKALQARRGPVILTPHHGEFMRLCPQTDPSVKLAATLECAKLYGALVVYKGHQTIVATPDGRFGQSQSTTPFCASAGTGDVLAGIIGGLLAQGLEPFDAACGGVWLHGQAANRVGPGLIASDLITHLPDLLNELVPSPLKRFNPPVDRP
jgi:NAD(P)H-hydrate epimerase